MIIRQQPEKRRKKEKCKRREVKEYIEERLGSLETEKSDSKYKAIMGED